MDKFNTLKDYCHFIDWHVGDLILRKNVAFDTNGNVLAEYVKQ